MIAPRVGIWGAGIIGSILAHGGLLIFLSLSVDPKPVPKQPNPTSKLEVQAYDLNRTKAAERHPDTQRTDTANPDSTALNAGAIPRPHAKSARPRFQALVDAPPKVEKLAADTSQAATANEVHHTAAQVPEAKPDAPKLTATQQAPPSIKAARSTPTMLGQKATPTTILANAVLRSDTVVAQILPHLTSVQTAAPATTILPAETPTSTLAPQASARPRDLPATHPDTRPVTAQHINAAYTAPIQPNAHKVKAALAFSGANGDVDPISIAAFQSFMQPGDIAAKGDPLRDGISGLLAQVPCSRLQVGFDPETATLQINGHIPEGDLRAPVLAALRAQMGADIAVSDNILILPHPQCGALAGIAGVGLPQSTDQITNPLVVGQDTHAKVFTFIKGDLWSLNMVAPDYDAYIYLDYFDAGGMVLHVEPNELAPLRHAATQSIVQNIGGETDRGAGLRLVIGPPYGQEIAVAFAASQPLYDGLRPIQEPAAAYLEWLKTRVTQARADDPDFKGEWVYFFVSTTEQ